MSIDVNLPYYVLPIPFRSKGPRIHDWPNLRITTAEVENHFNCKPQNIGVLLGVEPSFLIDIDLDSASALKISNIFLPPTNSVFGRNSNPRSHYLYGSDLRTEKFINPFHDTPRSGTIVEIRGKGCQTVFPPSTHPSGELIQWHNQGEPAQIDGARLRRAVGLLASSCIFEGFWKEGRRHDLSLAIAGALLRNGYSDEEAEKLIRAVCHLCADGEIDDRLRAVSATREKLLHDNPSWGLPKLVELTNEQCVKTLGKFLKLNLGTSAIEISQASTSEQKSKCRLDFQPLNALMDKPEEQFSYIWEDTLFAGGTSICAAKPKVGKSTFARNLAGSMVDGSVFLGRPVLKGKVLYLCLEEKLSEAVKQFRAMGVNTPDIEVYAGSMPEVFIEPLEAAIREHNADLVIVDPLSRILRVSDFNDYAQVSQALEQIVDLARRTNAHILMLHHEGKNEREGGDAMLGSTALFAAVDCLIQIRKKNNLRTIFTSQRHGEDLEETVVELNKETGIISEKGQLNAILMAQKKNDILAAFVGGEKLSEGEIKERVSGSSKGLISTALRQLVKDSSILREGKGIRNSPFLYSKVRTGKVGF